MLKEMFLMISRVTLIKRRALIINNDHADARYANCTGFKFAW